MLGRPYDFASDNAAGVDPRILAAITDSNFGMTSPYGADELSLKLNALYSEVFERDAFVFVTPTGTAANGLALGAVTPSYGAIFCHENSHIVTTECGAPEFFSCGARLIPLPGGNGKVSDKTFKEALTPYLKRNNHHLRASTISLTQATEAGTTYDCAEVKEISQIAHSAGMTLHMDGARFANAMVQLGRTPAEMTWKSGVDILSLGVTKNGGASVEAVVTFDEKSAETLRYLHKRAGFLFSKMRFASAQLHAYVTDGIWIENAHKANANAARLARALAVRDDVTFEWEVRTNQIFAHLPMELTASLAKKDIVFRPWPHKDGDLFRIVCSFNDADDLIARFEQVVSGADSVPSGLRLDTE
ncbi:threonine aldolase family protein [Paraburkholderia sp.]|uniref:threonine aldolase family protein n=1 Tax=Paraburkholderia sp. TaxID=1926495 RepID=UPI003C7E9B3F